MNIKSVLISGITALVVTLIVILGYSLARPTSVVLESPVRDVIKEVIKDFGAAPGNELPGPVVKFNGAPVIALSQRMNIGTTTPCTFDLRPYASSTILSLGATLKGVPTTTGTYWRWYTGVGMTSTTTYLAGRTLTATGSSVFATTTLNTNDAVIDTNDNFLVLDFNGGSTPFLGSTQGTQTGDCSVLLSAPSA